MAKKNFRKIPKSIILKLNKINSNQIVVGCVKTFSADDIRKGSLSYLSIKLTDSGLSFSPSILPSQNRGKYSRRNKNGYEIKRRDLPMEPYTISVESPNWGDSYNGTHTVHWTKERYPIEFHAPESLEIKIESPNNAPGQDKYIIKFEVEEVMDKKSRDFKERLLKNLNILQENVGHCDVLPAGRSLNEYLRTLHVSWEILPPGTREEALARLTKGRILSEQERKETEDRYDFFQSLKPVKTVYGMSGSERYLGALLREDCIVFENMEYGNAVYVMFEDWQTLSQKSRVELLSGRYGKNFERIVHRKGWKSQVKEIIKKYMAILPKKK
ncbi:MAG: hypothetical protein PHE30_02420 [Candidatus Omnitrophica bacterium]|nr:hypothetical protein [Candidatus Omnitrophota bacterium]